MKDVPRWLAYSVLTTIVVVFGLYFWYLSDRLAYKYPEVKSWTHTKTKVKLNKNIQIDMHKGTAKVNQDGSVDLNGDFSLLDKSVYSFGEEGWGGQSSAPVLGSNRIVSALYSPISARVYLMGGIKTIGPIYICVSTVIPVVPLSLPNDVFLGVSVLF